MHGGGIGECGRQCGHLPGQHRRGRSGVGATERLVYRRHCGTAVSRCVPIGNGRCARGTRTSATSSLSVWTSWSRDAHSDPETARRGQREGKERGKDTVNYSGDSSFRAHEKKTQGVRDKGFHSFRRVGDFRRVQGFKGFEDFRGFRVSREI